MVTFWLMAGFSVVPDVIRYGRNRNAADPKHGLMSGGVRGMLAALIVLAYPIFDISFVTCVRLLEGRKIYQGGRDHSSHRFDRLLRGHRRTALMVYALCVALAQKQDRGRALRPGEHAVVVAPARFEHGQAEQAFAFAGGLEEEAVAARFALARTGLHVTAG